ncbi:MAG: hypothetical protein OXC41_07170 [Gammaproteobacteria bacterium]|nr:hypothetical protein [Gammaproteobacteria bacterium]
MRSLILVLFASALLIACSGEKSEESAVVGGDTSSELTAQDKVSDSEYAKKYGAAMKQAMSQEKEE